MRPGSLAHQLLMRVASQPGQHDTCSLVGAYRCHPEHTHAALIELRQCCLVTEQRRKLHVTPLGARELREAL